MICFPENFVREAIDLFSIRFKMHLYVYTHKGVKQIEYMVSICLTVCLCLSVCLSLTACLTVSFIHRV